MKPKQPRNEQARALRARAGNANVPIAVDTRPKQTKPKKGTGSYRRFRCYNHTFEAPTTRREGIDN